MWEVPQQCGAVTVVLVMHLPLTTECVSGGRRARTVTPTYVF